MVADSSPDDLLLLIISSPSGAGKTTLTRDLLQRAGGELEVISEKGVGTIMRISFPLHGKAQVVKSVA